jgi:hypothetical protein
MSNIIDQIENSIISLTEHIKELKTDLAKAKDMLIYLNVCKEISEKNDDKNDNSVPLVVVDNLQQLKGKNKIIDLAQLAKQNLSLNDLNDSETTTESILTDIDKNDANVVNKKISRKRVKDPKLV